ncbi:DUF4268 domain-containing protein [Nitrosovibrio sp. Nv4]|uniref:DUF4268 domain-containing protein n=1 Tax=Nitrosovibrio sp. Nv4 TaxID=1945880 RepID=UPI000BD11F99|nr:DUF4268 domain-containing protein [Nitrosovibrio sp. Nv4]SOD42740.1 protein of unknown function [Nitrosovibrio sp. Nv4]
MYRINHISNRITKVKEAKFSELGFTERNHLQEWIANQPNVLGEELLIIQKEFDGFDDTKERLDLLAIDKRGGLVIIENKLDDSGRDVVWQALKYASYCSTLSKTQITEIFQSYLDRNDSGKDAKAQICVFLEQEDFSEVVLNSGNDQRLIMVAAQFRKEVTSTVLWLLKHGVFIKCFKAMPYQDGVDLFLSIEQVIPLPEAEDFMIGVSQKEVEEQFSERSRATRHQRRRDFWQRVLEALGQSNNELYANISASHDPWLNAGSGLRGVSYSMVFNRDEVRVALELHKSSKEQNKKLFDRLHDHKLECENAFGAPLSWRRMDDNKRSFIEYARSFDGYAQENWPDMIEWLIEHIQKLEAVFGPRVPEIVNSTRQ